MPPNDEIECRTAQKHSNANGRERLRQAATGQRAAPTTANDLGAESSHRGITPINVVCADLKKIGPQRRRASGTITG
jgi:hypothetical protein